MYLSAPLPFMGQKRMFAREFVKVLGQFPDSTVFVDLFGGIRSDTLGDVRLDGPEPVHRQSVQELPEGGVQCNREL